MRKTINFLLEFSVPLILGVVSSLIIANIDEQFYHKLVHQPFWDGHISLGFTAVSFSFLNLHFLMNDVFMVFFFGIAAVEITQSLLPGGSLNPMSKAANPLLATLGGVVGPALTYLLLCFAFNVDKSYYKGWGIPTATDIALAWLAARMVFGSRHPAVSFLLLLAIADDAIGLAIIAIFYPDPAHPVELQYLLLVVIGMVISWLLRRGKILNFWPYVGIGGTLAWLGLMKAHLHPALALVFIIPFIPHSSSSAHYGELFEMEEGLHSALEMFEKKFKYFVDFGLFGFGLANAGVAMTEVNNLTWIVFLSLLIGKSFGITTMSMVAAKLHMPLPEGMSKRSLVVASVVAGLGLTVALFVAGEAFSNPKLQGAAKMGAVFSGLIFLPALILGRLLGIKRISGSH